MESLGLSMMRERVEESVGGGVVGLSSAADHAGNGREEDEGGQVEMFGELVQVEGSIDLGTQDGAESLWGERGEHAIVQDAGSMDDSGERMLRGDGAQKRFEGAAVGGVAGRQRDGGAGGLQ